MKHSKLDTSQGNFYELLSVTSVRVTLRMLQATRSRQQKAVARKIMLAPMRLGVEPETPKSVVRCANHQAIRAGQI